MLSLRLTKPVLMFFAVVLTFLLAAIPGCKHQNSPVPTGAAPVAPRESVLDRVKRTGVLRVAWTGYPPYTQLNPSTGDVEGYSADMIRSLLTAWKREVKIEWVETNWARMKTDIATERFDVLIDPVFQTVPRAGEAAFTRPFGYFGYGIPVVRVDDNRFANVDDFNKSTITLGLTPGVASYDFVKSRLPLAKVLDFPGTNDVPLTNVMLGKADAAFADEPTVRRFLAAHGDKVKALSLETPPVHVAAGFMIPPGDPAWRDFLNTSLDFLENSGELRLLAEKHKVPYFPISSKFIEYRQSPRK